MFEAVVLTYTLFLHEETNFNLKKHHDLSAVTISKKKDVLKKLRGHDL